MDHLFQLFLASLVLTSNNLVEAQFGEWRPFSMSNNLPASNFDFNRFPTMAPIPIPSPSDFSFNFPDMNSIMAKFPDLSKSFLDAAMFQAAQNASLFFGPNTNPFLKFPTWKGLEAPGSVSGVLSAPARPESTTTAQEAATLEGLSSEVSKKLKLNETDKATILPELTVQSDNCTNPEEQPAVSLASPFGDLSKLPACVLNKYRTFDGSCNNPAFLKRGKDSSPFVRLLRPAYSDGISQPRRGIRGRELPSARLVSTTVVGQEINLAPWTHLFMQFGQFMDHDLTSTPNTQLSAEQPRCCGTNNTHPACFPIAIPPGDPFFSRLNQTCMEFVRSLPTTRPGCRLGPREQMNQLNSYIDGNQIYGTSDSQVKAVREFKNGLLKVGRAPNGPHHYTLMPGGSPDSCRDHTEARPCFVAGDQRAHVQIGLQALHVMFMRWHNRIASELLNLNPVWEDEKIFQETRAIVAASLQHITYNEWLPVLLGPREQVRQKLELLRSGRFNSYNVRVDPTISNEFATAAFRVGHVMVTGLFNRVTGNNTIFGTDQMQDTFLKSSRLYEPLVADQIVTGMSRDLGKRVENSMTPDLQQHCYGNGNKAPGLDLTSLNIQRGRDHGLPGYMRYRQFCRLPTAANFTALRELGDLPEDVVRKLASVYEDVEDIDIFIGGISERRLDGGTIGRTFACIISEQFRRLRSGDRFWYENAVPLPSALTDAQLTEIRKVTMARVICETNLVTTTVQPRVFEGVTASNSLTNCDNLPRMDLSAWRDKL